MLQRSLYLLLNKRISLRSISGNGIKICTRSFASPALKVHSTPKPINSKLLRTLNTEIESQKEVYNEQAKELDPQNVIQEFTEFFNENNWKLDHPEGKTQVTLKRRDEVMKADVILKFDLVQVFNELYENDAENEFDNELQEEEEEDFREEMKNSSDKEINDEMDMDVDEDLEISALPFTLQIQRDSIPEKILMFECIAEGTEEDSQLIIENVSILPAASATADSLSTYTAPNFSQLDEALQEAFEDYVKKLVGETSSSADLFTFMKSYSVAKEAQFYESWLQSVKDLVKN